MADIIWRGDAAIVKQVDERTPASFAAGNTFTTTLNGKAYTYTVGGGDTASTITAYFVTAIGQYDNPDSIPEYDEVSAANDSGKLVVTGPTTGKPFTITYSASGGTAAWTTGTDVTAESPNHANVGDNWSGGSVPGASDNVSFENNSVDCLYGLSALSAVTLTNLYVKASFTGKIGLANYNSDLGYYEYRDTEFQTGATNVYVGQGDGAGSSRVKLNLGSVQTEVRVYNTATAEESELGALVIRGTNTSNVIRVTRGDVGIATNKLGDASAIATAQIAFEDSQDTDAKVRFGAGITQLTTITQDGGEVYIECDCGTLTQNGGESWILNASSPTTVDVLEGVCHYDSTGTLAQAYVSDGGTLEFQRIQSRTVTNCSIYSGATLLDPSDTVTWSNAINLVRCSLTEVTCDFGTDGTILPT